MPNEQLVAYIRDQLGKGVSRDEIIHTLIATGWLIQDINVAFESSAISILSASDGTSTKSANVASVLLQVRRFKFWEIFFLWFVLVSFIIRILFKGSAGEESFTGAILILATPISIVITFVHKWIFEMRHRTSDKILVQGFSPADVAGEHGNKIGTINERYHAMKTFIWTWNSNKSIGLFYLVVSVLAFWVIYRSWTVPDFPYSYTMSGFPEWMTLYAVYAIAFVDEFFYGLFYILLALYMFRRGKSLMFVGETSKKDQQIAVENAPTQPTVEEHQATKIQTRPITNRFIYNSFIWVVIFIYFLFSTTKQEMGFGIFALMPLLPLILLSYLTVWFLASSMNKKVSAITHTDTPADNRAFMKKEIPIEIIAVVLFTLVTLIAVRWYAIKPAIVSENFKRINSASFLEKTLLETPKDTRF